MSRSGAAISTSRLPRTRSSPSAVGAWTLSSIRPSTDCKDDRGLDHEAAGDGVGPVGDRVVDAEHGGEDGAEPEERPEDLRHPRRPGSVPLAPEHGVAVERSGPATAPAIAGTPPTPRAATTILGAGIRSFRLRGPASARQHEPAQTDDRHGEQPGRDRQGRGHEDRDLEQAEVARPVIWGIHQHERIGRVEPVRRRGQAIGPRQAAPERQAQQPAGRERHHRHDDLVRLGDLDRDRQRQRAAEHRDRRRDGEEPHERLAIDAAQKRGQRDHRQGTGQEGQDRRQPREQLAQHDLGIREVRGRHLRQDAPARSWQSAPAVAAGATRSIIESWMPARA